MKSVNTFVADVPYIATFTV